MKKSFSISLGGKSSMPNESRLRVSVKGGFGATNFGDDALMVAVCEAIYRAIPLSEIVIICPGDTNYVQKMLPNVIIVNKKNEKEIVSELLLYGGGTQFYSFALSSYQRQKSGYNYHKKKLAKIFMLPYLDPIIYCRKLRAQMKNRNQLIAAIGIGAGPFFGEPHKIEAVKKLFRKMSFISVRDKETYRLCKIWGVGSPHHHSDLCYLPKLWEIPSRRNFQSSVDRIGVIVRDWPHSIEGDSYYEKLFHVTKVLRKRGKTVNFILFTAGKDQIWMRRLHDRNETVISWHPENETIDDFLVKLSQYDVFITARYHGAIFASLLTKPTVCIGIEPKLELVSELLNKGSRLWSYPFESEACLSAIEDLEEKYLQAVDSLEKVVREQSSLAESAVASFALFVKNSFPGREKLI